ncbi:hypothetical protein TetV_490 [Tetraselmis virus 1]|uniref:Uncharacterized protein n=1 Tax=Tetraselmis virus 1 TaxID=2060617 RepID=A0A2P0VNW3_9VIRU|nr:hypothetical protein QJ968_gp564 [Tetraselmis virus 1]AUF82572.1 hypothetical protein TetV_490 [Tetraselmis virus 1]
MTCKYIRWSDTIPICQELSQAFDKGQLSKRSAYLFIKWLKEDVAKFNQYDTFYQNEVDPEFFIRMYIALANHGYYDNYSPEDPPDQDFYRQYPPGIVDDPQKVIESNLTDNIYVLKEFPYGWISAKYDPDTKLFYISCDDHQESIKLLHTTYGKDWVSLRTTPHLSLDSYIPFLNPFHSCSSFQTWAFRTCDGWVLGYYKDDTLYQECGSRCGSNCQDNCPYHDNIQIKLDDRLHTRYAVDHGMISMKTSKTQFTIQHPVFPKKNIGAYHYNGSIYIESYPEDIRTNLLISDVYDL